jgi:hypothetical protein
VGVRVAGLDSEGGLPGGSVCLVVLTGQVGRVGVTTRSDLEREEDLPRLSGTAQGSLNKQEVFGVPR